MCTTLLAAVQAPVLLGPQSFTVTASIGIALYPRHGADPETLLRHADAALNAAKQARSAHAEYQPGLEHHSVERLKMVTGLRQAIAEGELVLYYQPKVDCRTGEAMPLKVAVNLSTWDLQDPRLAARICELLESYRLPPELLSLEITETAVLADPSRAMKVLNELAVRGVHAALDDFGTGYSSLTYVRQLLLQELKIDASFVRGLAHGERDRAIVCSTIDLGHRLRPSVVAESVEDRATLDLLAELGCDQAQGFYVSRPMPAEDVADWVRSRQRLESPRATAA